MKMEAGVVGWEFLALDENGSQGGVPRGQRKDIPLTNSFVFVLGIWKS